MYRIGLDFDNTLVCYDELFHRAALEHRWIAPDVAARKAAVRDAMRRDGREQDWIALQGEVYGSRMREAQAFPGAIDFVREARREGWQVFIVSHKTRHPFSGPRWDLHAAARDWIDCHLGDECMDEKNVFFELTKAEKLARIGSCGCTHFLDDLPEILLEADFPPATRALLFDPARALPADERYIKVDQWRALRATVRALGETP